MWAVVMDLPKLDIKAEILSNTEVGPNVYEMKVTGEALARQAMPGQFVHVRIPAGMLLLRRPFGVANVDDKGTLTIYYRVMGKGTSAMTSLRSGETLNFLGPLGQGFSLHAKRPLIVGGGMGLAPLLYLAKQLHGAADVLMGGRNASELFWERLFRPYARDIFLTSDDGSRGEKGFVTNLLPRLLSQESYDCIYTCGPEIMMRGIAKIASDHDVPCQASLEKRMACGLGACLSCVCDTTKKERKKICKDGPVFWAQEVFAAD
ncbi:MAG: dihydroorotate dehydrogenase electron transfer subunit [Selenomonadaceae bacterium]|nr:dihydroorotate dehydrogenase electron transfer subunit [Selenomonadaceae bacterium]